MLRGFFSSERYSTIFSSESERPNQVKYHVRNGTMMKSEATMMSQMLLGRRGFVAGGRLGGVPVGLYEIIFHLSFEICHWPLNATEGTEETEQSTDYADYTDSGDVILVPNIGLPLI